MTLYQHDHAAMFRFVLVGDLTGASVEELRCAWQTASSVLRGRELVLDLSKVSNIDENGLRLLSRMKEAGARISSREAPECQEVLRFLDVTPAAPKKNGQPAGRSRGWLRFARSSD